jgi:hypothetical protein
VSDTPPPVLQRVTHRRQILCRQIFSTRHRANAGRSLPGRTKPFTYCSYLLQPFIDLIKRPALSIPLLTGLMARPAHG